MSSRMWVMINCKPKMLYYRPCRKCRAPHFNDNALYCICPKCHSDAEAAHQAREQARVLKLLECHDQWE